MADARYDNVGDFYIEFVRRNLAWPPSSLAVATGVIERLAQPVDEVRVLDLACGEGHLSRRLAGLGAKMTGVDVAEHSLAEARRLSPEIAFFKDDAQVLATQADDSFERVVCNLALMDIPDFAAVCRAVRRVLVPGGRFLFSVLHPAFNTPFRVPNAPIELDADGNFVAHRVFDYATEGHWNSGGDGVRGRVGAHHRTVSTYVNTLLAHGFQLKQMEEPTAPIGKYEYPIDQRSVVVPSVLVISAEL